MYFPESCLNKLKDANKDKASDITSQFYYVKNIVYQHGLRYKVRSTGSKAILFFWVYSYWVCTTTLNGHIRSKAMLACVETLCSRKVSSSGNTKPEKGYNLVCGGGSRLQSSRAVQWYTPSENIKFPLWLSWPQTTYLPLNPQLYYL